MVVEKRLSGIATQLQVAAILGVSFGVVAACWVWARGPGLHGWGAAFRNLERGHVPHSDRSCLGRNSIRIRASNQTRRRDIGQFRRFMQ